MTSASKTEFSFPDPGTVRVVGGEPYLIEYRGRTVEVFVKPGARAASEAAGNLVAKRLGLETLEPWLLEDDGRLLYATTREPLETMKEAGIGYDSDYWAEGVKAPWFRQAFVFDTLIGNYDRVLRNMCFRGAAPDGDFVFMDFDKVFLLDEWTADSLDAMKADPGHNNLARFVPLLDAGDKKAILHQARKWQTDLSTEAFDFLDKLLALALVNEAELAAIKGFLRHRARNLTPLVYAQLTPGR